MLKPLGKTTYEDAVSWGEEVIDRLMQEEEYAAVCDRLSQMGVEMEWSLHHTKTEEARGCSYTSIEDAHGKLKRGYAMELWVDFVKDGFVLASSGDEEERIQYSLSMTAVRQINGLVLSRVEFLDYQQILDSNKPFAMMDSFAEAMEKDGYLYTPFTQESRTPMAPVGTMNMIENKRDLLEGSYVELSPKDYDGTFGGEDSVFFATHCFLPYRYLLLPIVGLDKLSQEAITLTPEESTRWATLIGEAIYELEDVEDFADAMSNGCGIAAYAPPPKTEEILNAVTVFRMEAFKTETEKMLLWLQNTLEQEKPVTLIW